MDVKYKSKKIVYCIAALCFILVAIYINIENRPVDVIELENAIEQMEGIEECKVVDWIGEKGEKAIKLELTPSSGEQIYAKQSREIKQEVKKYYQDLSDENILISEIHEVQDKNNGISQQPLEIAQFESLRKSLEVSIQQMDGVENCSVKLDSLDGEYTAVVSVKCIEGHIFTEEQCSGIKKLLTGCLENTKDEDIEIIVL